jgi:transcriptional regulator with XRE-family HTH domain
VNAGPRIRERLGALEISQSELARRVGITQATIAGLLSGKARSSAHLHKIARELGTTPAYLTGETDDPDSDVPDEPEFDSNERELIDCYRNLSAPTRAALMQVARSMAANAGGPEPRRATAG